MHGTDGQPSTERSLQQLMTCTVLGISAFYHDSAAAIVRDGSIVAAAQEERFTRKKHDANFPDQAINYCLEEAFVEPDDLDAVIYYDSPLMTWDRVVRSSLMGGEASRAQFVSAAQSILGKKMWVADHVQRCIGSLGKAGKLLYAEHHMAHAASAFFPSPFDRAAVLTLDGVGEWCTTSIGRGDGAHLELLKEIHYPHSLGLLYSALTYYCGFKVNSGEYKLMGLAPYGAPKYTDRIRDHLIEIKDDGSFQLNLEYFGYPTGLVMTNDKFHALFDGPPRPPESKLRSRDMDLAASIQVVITEAVLAIARHARSETGCLNLVLAGGVALNCVANGVLMRSGIFDDIWVQPAAGDAGGALGAALLAHHSYFDNPRQVEAGGGDSQKGSYLGPSFSQREIAAFLDRHDYPYQRVGDDDRRAHRVAEALADGMLVGFFSGRMAFGPRALGARSILGDPRQADTQSRMNLRIKYRESFRPFAPSVLREDVREHFDQDWESPYMVLVGQVKESRRIAMDREAFESGEEDVHQFLQRPRSHIPAITHVDYTARIQTVTADHQPSYYSVIRAFKELTGVGVLVNTSFNVRGEPIVCTPKDAYACFMGTELDLLVLEDCLVWKKDQPPYARRRAPQAQGSAKSGKALSLIERFFTRSLEPLARDNVALGTVPTSTLRQESSGSEETWYIPRQNKTMSRSDFETLGCDSVEDLEDTLREFWIARGQQHLAVLAPGLARIARALCNLEEPVDEPTQFVYAMT